MTPYRRGQLCTRCHERWSQSTLGLCRRCEREREGRATRLRRLPGSLDEARAMAAYAETILATSTCPARRYRAERLLTNLRPVIALFEARVVVAPAPPSAPRTVIVEGEEFEIVWP